MHTPVLPSLIVDDSPERLPLLPWQEWTFAGPRYPDDGFYRAPTRWGRCALCSHHADIPVGESLCPACETYSA